MNMVLYLVNNFSSLPQVSLFEYKKEIYEHPVYNMFTNK